jgi:hypothetical protein
MRTVCNGGSHDGSAYKCIERRGYGTISEITSESRFHSIGSRLSNEDAGHIRNERAAFVKRQKYWNYSTLV